MNFLKAVGKFFGGFFVLFGITIFIMSYFGIYAVNNFNVLENDVKNLGVDLNQLEEYCSQNLNDANCQNSMLKGIKKEIDDFRYYGSLMRVIGFIIFILGFLLFVWCSGWMNGLRQTSLISLIGIIFSYIYYKYAIINAINSFLSEEIIEIINNWATITINKTLNLILILGVIFLILTISLYILKYKKMKLLEKAPTKK